MPEPITPPATSIVALNSPSAGINPAWVGGALVLLGEVLMLICAVRPHSTCCSPRRKKNGDQPFQRRSADGLSARNPPTLFPLLPSLRAPTSIVSTFAIKLLDHATMTMDTSQSPARQSQSVLAEGTPA